MDLDPDFGFGSMVLTEPAVKAACIDEFVNFIGVNKYGCHAAAGNVWKLVMIGVVDEC